MGKLSVTVSAVDAYAQRLGAGYMNIAQESTEIQTEVSEMLMRVQQAQEDVTYQLAQTRELVSEAHSKAMMYESSLESAQRDADDASAEMDYIQSHPIPVTREDSEGNTYTEYVIDEAAYAAASSRYNTAMSQVQYFSAKYTQAMRVTNEATAVCARFENMQRAIASVENLIQEQQYQISQHHREICSEANYNLQYMRNVLEKMGDYLACKPIFIPEKIG